MNKMWIAFAALVVVVVAVAVTVSMPYVAQQAPVKPSSSAVAAPTFSPSPLPYPTGMTYHSMCSLMRELNEEVAPDITRVAEVLSAPAPDDSYLYKLNLEIVWLDYQENPTVGTRVAVFQALLEVTEYCNS